MLLAISIKFTNTMWARAWSAAGKFTSQVTNTCNVARAWSAAGKFTNLQSTNIRWPGHIGSYWQNLQLRIHVQDGQGISGATGNFRAMDYHARA